MAGPGAVRRKGQAAGPGAAAPVAAASAQKGAHVALAGNAHAQRTVHEHLHLDGAVFGDVFNLGKAQLPGQNHPGEAQLSQLQRTLQRVHAHLGGAVDGQVGGHAAGKSRHRQILQNHRVRPGGAHVGQRVTQALHLRRVGGGVDGHIHLHAAAVAEAHRLPQLVCIKVAGGAPGAEPLQAQIHRVRPAVNRGGERVHIAGGGQNFHGCVTVHCSPRWQGFPRRRARLRRLPPWQRWPALPSEPPARRSASPPDGGRSPRPAWPWRRPPDNP